LVGIFHSQILVVMLGLVAGLSASVVITPWLMQSLWHHMESIGILLLIRRAMQSIVSMLAVVSPCETQRSSLLFASVTEDATREMEYVHDKRTKDNN
jgi:hypothetical protein